MFRAYDRGIIDAINSCQEVSTFIPALAYSFARNPAEVVVGHEERAAGESKYSLYSLIRLNFDLMTSFSLVPLQLFSMLGIGISVLSGFFVIFLFLRRLIIGPEVQGVFTLFAIAFFLIGITLFGIGLLGEYIGRIYQQVRHRPRYLVEAVLETQAGVKVRKPRAPRAAKETGEADPFASPGTGKKPVKSAIAEDAESPSLFSDKQE
jgi:undecaprenyl-phosphate 4-deoxy-4-formamido-L-arabinose transferase